jgi:hypothetical protein
MQSLTEVRARRKAQHKATQILDPDMLECGPYPLPSDRPTSQRANATGIQMLAHPHAKPSSES